MMTPPRLVAFTLLLTALPARAAAPPAPPVTFERHVRPILKAHCLECHGEAKRPRGGLDLRLRRLMLEGGDGGPAVVPGKPADSPLYRRIREHSMPPGKVKLSAVEIDRIAAWIAGGARGERPEPAKLAAGLHISDEDRAFWSLQPVRRPAVPAVRRPDLARTPIDAFLLARLEANGLAFAPPADRVALARRLSFGLTGLPPAPNVVDAFLADTRPGAYERLVERLLASPHFGERWGRHWLDVAGYADSHGGGRDPTRPYAWKYRDWVVRAINADMPYDRFVVEQLAGDELVRPPYVNLPAEDSDRLIATGFLRTAPDGTASPGADRKQASNQVVADTLQIVGTALLGTTLHCAQCHNHRYDPIPQSDYYRVRAVFEPAYNPQAWRLPPARLVSLLSPAQRKQGQQIEKAAVAIDRQRLAKQAEFIERTFRQRLEMVPAQERAAVEKAYRTPPGKRAPAQKKLLQDHPSVNVSAGSLYLYDKKAADELQRLADDAARLRASKPAEDFIDALTEVPGVVPATHLFNRGDPDQPGPVVAPGGLSVLAGLVGDTVPAKDPTRPTTGRRLAFARQLTSGKHPLTARVVVNRVWMHHFGKGLVATPADFGKLGEAPSHPELLDWLADEFVRSGWSMKHLHRLILTSAAYRQSSRAAAATRRVDPDNRLLGRMPVVRLEAEALRDAVLTVAGRLNRRLGGPPVPITPDTSGQIVLGVDQRDGAGRPRSEPLSLGRDAYRRSVYVQVRRSMTLSVLEAFDPAATSPNCERRAASTVAPQALLLMNSAFLVDASAAFARRVAAEAGAAPPAQARHAWRLAFGRPPDARQLAGAVAYLEAQTEHYRSRKGSKGGADAPLQALATFCHALLSSNPFLYVD